MGIVRTRTILTRSTGAQTHHAVLGALAAAGLEILDQANPIRAKSARSLMKNRWAANLTIEVIEDRMVWTVDALGDKHDQIVDELLAQLPPGMVDDQGVADALARLPKSSKRFGNAEVKKLATILTPTEHVVALAIGTYEKTMGALVLTTERLVFFDQTLKAQRIEEFSLDAIQSLGVSKKMTGETINIAISGRNAEITNIFHGEGEALVAAFREVRNMRTAPPAQPVAAPALAVADQIRQLADLHQAGILTDDEFAAKKAELLDRL
nr:PH domain-containing protein [Dietzia maris]